MTNSYTLTEPWKDSAWLLGRYTAGVCAVGQNLTTNYYQTRPMGAPNGSLVAITDMQMNNYVSFAGESVSYRKPRVESYDCDCGDDGCSTCYRCRYDNVTTSIYGLGYRGGAWDIERYDNALSSLELANIACNIRANITETAGPLENVSLDFGGDRYGVTAAVESAYNAYAQAQNLYTQCMNSDTYPVNQYVATTQADRTITYEQFLAAYHPNSPTIPGSPCSVNRPANPNGPVCKSYPLKWQETAGNALAAMANSFVSADTNVRLLKEKYNTLNFSGICDSDYTESPKAKCDEMRSDLAIIDSGTKESTYGQLATAKEKRSKLQLAVFCFPPDFTEYKEIMKLLWQKDSGFNPLVVKLVGEGETAFSNANSIYGNYLGQASNYSSRVAAKKKELDDDKLSQITEARSTQGFDETRIGTIAERYSQFAAKKTEADSLASSATSVYGKKQRGYLKDATLKATEAAALYAGMESQGAAILADASAVVQEKKQTAEVLIQQAAALYQRTQNANVGRYYQKAQQELGTGNSAGALGDKYSHYIAAASYARTALNNGNALENETAPLAQQLDDLIRRAEIDEINVESEKTALESMEQSGEYDATALRRAVESIIRKAGIKYGDLIDIKAGLLEDIAASGNCGSDLAGDVSRADSGLVTASGIDYLNAIGRLESIAAEYERIGEEAAECADQMLLSDLRIERTARVTGDIKIDEPSPLSITIIVTNLGRRSGTDADVPIDLGVDVQLLLTDIKGGKENVNSVRVENGTMVFTIKEIKPYRTFSLNIEKNATLARTTAVEKSGVGREDGSVDVTEERTIELYAAGSLALPQGTTAAVDGGPARVLDMGTHTVVMQYLMENGYETEEEVETTKLGTNVQVEKRITITPNIDITSLPLTVALDYPEITGLSATARGAAIASRQCNASPCMLELTGLQAGEEAVVFIDFMVINAPEVLSTIAPTLPNTDNCFGSGKKCGPIPDELSAVLAQINAAVAANDTAAAIELKEKFDADLDAWNREQKKTYDGLVALKTSMQAELGELEDALGPAKGNSSLTAALGQRRDAVQAGLRNAESADNIADELGALKAVGGETAGTLVDGYLATAWNEYNSLKVQLANAGISTTPQEFIDVEDKLSALELDKDPKTAVGLSEALGTAAAYVQTEEGKADAELDQMAASYEELKEKIDGGLGDYAKQLADAEGTEWETLFGLDTEKVENLMEEVQKYIDEGNIRMAKMKLDQLEGKAGKVEEALAEVKDEAEGQFIAIRSEYEEKKNAMPNEVRTAIENGLSAMAGEIAEGQYVQAMKRGKELLKTVGGVEAETINPLLAVIALAAVGIAVGIYYMKKKGGGLGGEGPEGGEMSLPFLTKKKREFKPLPKVGE